MPGPACKDPSGATCIGGIQQTAPPPTWTPADALNAAAADAADHVENVAASYGSTFAGNSIDSNGTLDVHYINGTDASAFIAAATSAAAIPNLSFVAVNHTQDELNGIVSAINADEAYWSSQGAVLASYGLDPSRNAVIVNLVDASYTDALAAAFVARYGDAVIVTPGGVAPNHPFLGRGSDIAPYFGGDKVAFTPYSGGSSTGEICTLGFPMKQSNGAYFAYSAAHCFVGTSNNRSWPYVHMGSPSGTYFAKEYYWDYGTGWDYTLVAYTHTSDQEDPDIWTTSTAVRGVASVAGSDPVGTHICSAGASTNEVCTITVDLTNAIIHEDPGQSDDHIFYHGVEGKSSGARPATGGDSGGTTYSLRSDGNVIARGEILSGNGTTTVQYYPVYQLEHDLSYVGATVVHL